VTKAIPGLLARKVFKVFAVKQEPLEHRDFPVKKATKAIPDLLVRAAFQVNPALLENAVRRAIPVQKDLKAKVDPWVRKVQRATSDQRDLQDQKVKQVQQANKDP
jgi:hypothetical protein